MEKEPLGEQGLFDVAFNLANQGYKEFVLVVSKPGKAEEETDIQVVSNVSVPDSVYYLEMAKHDLMYPLPEEE